MGIVEKPLSQDEVDTWRVPIPGGAAILAPLDRLAQWARKSSLWSLTFGNSAAGCPAAPPAGSGLPTCGKAGPYNALFFTAGPDEEMHGLFGMLTAIAAEQDGDEE